MTVYSGTSRDSIDWFYRPFRKMNKAQILALAEPEHHMVRDAIPLAQLARLFDADREGIVIEPARRGVELQPNRILLGSLDLYKNPAAHHTFGNRPLEVEVQKFSRRIQALQAQTCIEIQRGSDPEVQVVNRVTGETFRPKLDAKNRVVVDYGWVVRSYPGPPDNLISISGGHRLGTFGASTIASARYHLDEIHRAVEELDESQGELPLEVLVRTEFFPQFDGDVHAPTNVKAKPLMLFYDRRWAFDLRAEGQKEWFDQRPWSVRTVTRAGVAPRTLAAAEEIDTLPRLEITADLTYAAGELRDLVRRLIVSRGNRRLPRAEPRPAEYLSLLREVSRHAKLFQMKLMRDTPARRTRMLPSGPETSIRNRRTEYVLCLVFAHLLGKPFVASGPLIREVLPQYRPEADEQSLMEAFVKEIQGKRNEGFGLLFSGDGPDEPPFASIESSRGDHTYRLQPERAAIVVRLRL